MNVLELRARLGLTRDEFASLVGCSYATVYRWEERGFEPDGALLVIMKAFDVASQKDVGRSFLASCAKDGVGLADVLQDLFAFWSADRNVVEEA